MLNIPLSDDAFDLLQMYAMPHVHREFPTPQSADHALRLSVAFNELREKGMVREGIGNAIVILEEGVVCDGTESIEEFEAKLKPHFKATPGWVATERGMQWIANKCAPEHREKALAVMRTLVLDKDTMQ